MNVVNNLYYWTDNVLWWGLGLMRLWAFVDCVSRKAAAFPAADKLSKVAWLLILLFAGVLGQIVGVHQQVGPISLISVVVVSVYLADVRPAVREISGGNSRW